MPFDKTRSNIYNGHIFADNVCVTVVSVCSNRNCQVYNTATAVSSFNATNAATLHRPYNSLLRTNTTFMQ